LIGGRSFMRIYENDSNQEVWNDLYKKIYIEDNLIAQRFDILNNESKRKRFIAYDKQDRGYFVGGETDFNFSKKIGQHRLSKYKIYQTILEKNNDEEKKKESLAYLEKCSIMTNNMVNFSLMLSQGSMQSLKGTISNDRFDLYLFLVDEYLRGHNELIFGHCAYKYMNYMKNFFALFNQNVYEFCKQIYFIYDENLVYDLINSGKKMMDSPERVMEYMNLAIRYWREKAKNCKEKYNIDISIEKFPEGYGV
jgi:hypothetical protein